MEKAQKNLLEYQGIKEAPFYFEGGNLSQALNRLGEKVYLSGANNLLFSLLNAKALFSSKQEKKKLLQEFTALKDTSLFLQ